MAVMTVVNRQHVALLTGWFVPGLCRTRHARRTVPPDLLRDFMID
jgi:hypothetical protein